MEGRKGGKRVLGEGHTKNSCNGGVLIFLTEIREREQRKQFPNSNSVSHITLTQTQNSKIKTD